MTVLPERGSTHIYKVNKISKDEIDEMTGRCVHDEPAFCNAACPLKLDTRAMLKAVSDGNLKKALQIYEKAVPFPLAAAFGCEAPCEEKCRLCEIGDGISINEIERAVALYAPGTRSGGVFRMKKKKTVAILGSDLFCLFLAGELEKKMYPLTLFCTERSAEEFLKRAAAYLPDEALKLEAGHFSAMDIDFRFGSDMTKELFESCRGEFDILCAAEGFAAEVLPEAACSEDIMMCPEEHLVMGVDGRRVIDTAFAARRAALTVDRLAQNLDPRNMRGVEGPVTSRLYTNLETAGNPVKTKKSGQVYSPDEAAREASRCIQCSCSECMKSCVFLKEFEKYPVLLAREIYNNTQIIMGDHPLNRVMNACSLCGQCSVVCPNGVDMAHVCKSARENMVSTDKMSLAVHEFALQDMLFSNEEAFLSFPQPGYGEAACRYVFFPGCQAAAVSPETVEAAYADLCARLEGGVALMLGCCGAICDWAGRYELYDETKAFLDRELDRLGSPTVITMCPSCRKELSGHPGIETVGIWDILNTIGLPEGCGKYEKTFAVHDSCGARGDRETQLSIRAIANKLGCEVTETEYSGDASPCCGYGGLTAYTNRDLARKMTQKCLERSDSPYITYCMACRDRFAAEGRESKHILELVYGTDAGAFHGITEKRYNRLTLKKNLMKKYLNEDMEEMDPGFTVAYTPEAEKVMEDRMILHSDITAVIQALRETGNAVLDSESGRRITSCRLGNVTFWAVYGETETGYLIYNAYSHRMTVEKREG